MSDEELAAYSLVELAVDRLRRDILSGRTEPGERLVEEQLTRRLGISRAPLREAMRLLAQQGLVEHIPRRGARVATLSDDDVRELYEVRDVLERHAISTMPAGPEKTGPEKTGPQNTGPQNTGPQNTGPQNTGPQNTGPDLTGLRSALDVMRKATEADDRLELANAHRRFHTEVVRLSGNRQLTDLYESILVRIQLYMAVNMRREAEIARAEDGVHRHERLFAAVESGDADAVRAALGEHGARAYLT